MRKLLVYRAIGIYDSNYERPLKWNYDSMNKFIFFVMLTFIISSTNNVVAEGTALPWNYSGVYAQTGSDGCIISGDFRFSVNEDGSAAGGYRPNADSCRPDWDGYSYFFSIQGIHANGSFTMTDGLTGTYNSLNMSGSRSDGIIVSAEREGGGVIETDGKLYLNSPPGGKLELTIVDLPAWALLEIVTAGAVASCVGPPDHITTGDSTVLLEGLPVARLNDETYHGGVIVEGSDRIFVNGVPAAFLGGFHICPMSTGSVPHVGGPIVNNGWSYNPSDSANLVSFLERSKRNPDLCTQSVLSEQGLAYEDGGALADWCVRDLVYTNKAASKGDTIIDVVGEGIEIGDTIIIGNDHDMSETAKVIGKGSLVIDHPLENSYSEGTMITRVPDEYANVTDQTVDGGGSSGGGGCFIGTLRY